MTKKKKKRSGRGTTILLMFVFLVGLSLLVYPSFADYYNSLLRAKDIVHYTEEVAEMEPENYEHVIRQAEAYNRRMLMRDSCFSMSELEKRDYPQMLSLGENGPIGYIEIQSIDVTLPIYHGTGEETLAQAVGHIEWSSLPIGGPSTHSVLSGHRGLPSARLFTDLDQMAEGDTFIIRVLDEILTYEVDQIRIVEPEDTSDLRIEPDKDYCTLLTCTPYGINTHRLLVRGHRIENAKEAANIRVVADAIQIEPLIVAPVIAVPLLIVMVIIVFIIDGKKNKKESKSVRNGGEL